VGIALNCNHGENSANLCQNFLNHRQGEVYVRPTGGRHQSYARHEAREDQNAALHQSMAIDLIVFQIATQQFLLPPGQALMRIHKKRDQDSDLAGRDHGVAQPGCNLAQSLAEVLAELEQVREYLTYLPFGDRGNGRRDAERVRNVVTGK